MAAAIKRFKPGKKRCKNCNNEFEKNVNQPFQICCTVKCAIEYVRKQADKKELKQQRTEAKELAEKWKRYPDWLKDLENLINTIVRLIDSDAPCISCGYGGKPQAGHYNSVQAAPTIRYNLHNIHRQCYQCNVPKSGNINGYDEGLIKIYGRPYWEYIKFGLKNTYHEPLKLSIPDIQTRLVICRVIIKEFTKGQIGDMDKIILRDELNTRIGIYFTTAYQH